MGANVNTHIVKSCKTNQESHLQQPCFYFTVKIELLENQSCGIDQIVMKMILNDRSIHINKLPRVKTNVYSPLLVRLGIVLQLTRGSVA